MASWADPPRRKDGRCARKGCERRVLGRPTKFHGDIDPAVYDDDPFCSGTCCRVYYGLERLSTPPPCAGCGCNRDFSTEGCEVCWKRHHQREKKKAAA